MSAVQKEVCDSFVYIPQFTGRFTLSGSNSIIHVKTVRKAPFRYKPRDLVSQVSHAGVVCQHPTIDFVQLIPFGYLV